MKGKGEKEAKLCYSPFRWLRNHHKLGHLIPTSTVLHSVNMKVQIPHRQVSSTHVSQHNSPSTLNKHTYAILYGLCELETYMYVL